VAKSSKASHIIFKAKDFGNGLWFFFYGFINKKSIYCITRDYTITSIVVAASPIVAMGFSYVIWLFVRTIQGDKERKVFLKPVIIMLSQPVIASAAYDILSCTDIGGTSNLRLDSSVDCSAGGHSFFQAVAAILLMVWGKLTFQTCSAIPIKMGKRYL
jgi:hypothetical protein